MKTLLISEKPSLTRTILQTLPQELGGSTVLHTMYLGPFRFAYPSSLTPTDIPHLSNPIYKLNREFNWSVTGQAFSCPSSPHELTVWLSQFKRIIVAVDQNPTSVFAARQIVDGLPVGTTLETIPLPHVLTPEAIASAYKNRVDFLSTTMGHFQSAQVRAYFDWNFNCNSLLVIGDALRQSNCSSLHLTKYQLLTLHEIARKTFASEGDVIRYMTKYPGSGKYGDDHTPSAIGSPASRAYILSSLQKGGLIELGAGRACLTEDGKKFYSRLHKRTYDPDLPHRLDQWRSMGIHECRHKIDRYIRSFFGKQHRRNSTNRNL